MKKRPIYLEKWWNFDQKHVKIDQKLKKNCDDYEPQTFGVDYGALYDSELEVQREVMVQQIN